MESGEILAFLFVGSISAEKGQTIQFCIDDTDESEIQELNAPKTVAPPTAATTE